MEMILYPTQLQECLNNLKAAARMRHTHIYMYYTQAEAEAEAEEELLKCYGCRRLVVLCIY